MENYLELAQLPDGSIVLRRSDDHDNPIVKIEFSKEFPKNHQLLKPFLDQKIIKQLINISNGWYFIEKKGDNLIFRDLRFGQLGMDVNTGPFLWFYELTIDDKIKKPIAKKMIFESINENTEIMVSYDNDEYTFNTVH